MNQANEYIVAISFRLAIFGTTDKQIIGQDLVDPMQKAVSEFAKAHNMACSAIELRIIGKDKA